LSGKEEEEEMKIFVEKKMEKKNGKKNKLFSPKVANAKKKSNCY